MWCKWNSFVYQHFIYLISVCVRLLVHNIVKRWKCVFIQNSNKMTSNMLFVFWWPGIVCLQILCENREIHIPISCTENLQLHVCIKKMASIIWFPNKIKVSLTEQDNSYTYQQTMKSINRIICDTNVSS